MWKRKEESETVVNAVKESVVVTPVKEVPPVAALPQERKLEMSTNFEAPKGAVAHIGKSVIIRGELSGSEDLYIDGQVEGTIELREHSLTVGPNGRVDAHVNAREVTLLGSVKGNIHASDRVDIRKSGSLNGDLVAARVVIEDGAYFKGSIDIQKSVETAPKHAEWKKAESSGAVLSDSSNKLAGVGLEAKK